MQDLHREILNNYCAKHFSKPSATYGKITQKHTYKVQCINDVLKLSFHFSNGTLDSKLLFKQIIDHQLPAIVNMVDLVHYIEENKMDCSCRSTLAFQQSKRQVLLRYQLNNYL